MKLRYYLLDTNILGPLAELRSGGKSLECKVLEKNGMLCLKAQKSFVPNKCCEVEYGLRIAPVIVPKNIGLPRVTIRIFIFRYRY